TEQKLRGGEDPSYLTIRRPLSRVAFFAHGANAVDLQQRFEQIKRDGPAAEQVGFDPGDFESLGVQHVSQLVVGDWIDMIEQRDLTEFVDWPRHERIEPGKEEFQPRCHVEDVWCGDYEVAARLQDAMTLAHEVELVLEMLDPLDTAHKAKLL